MSDHRSAFNKKKPNDSAMAKHCLDSKHDFNRVTGNLIHCCSKGKFMNKMEEVETISSFKEIGDNRGGYM